MCYLINVLYWAISVTEGGQFAYVPILGQNNVIGAGIYDWTQKSMGSFSPKF